MQFKKVDWFKGTNVYEVNIRQYTAEGNFKAFSKHLPRLHQMGVEVIWLMPVTPISLQKRQGTLGSYYACRSYTTINPEFGTAQDFHELVQQVHALGMKIIIDWVANHTGYDHRWTIEHPEWYVKDSEGNFTERNGWTDVIDLNYQNVNMRKAMIDAMRYWVNTYGIDGFRCDMAHLVPLDFWIDARKQLDSNKPLFWLAECENIAYHEVFDVSYAWEWMHATENFTKQTESLQTVRDVLHRYSQYPTGAAKLFFTSNHDENSWNGTEYEKYGVVAKAWAVFTALWQGIPLIYSGQEQANTKRLAFFDKDQLAWDEEPPLTDFYRRLLHLRKQSLAVSSGETFILPTENDNNILLFMRRKNEELVLVLLNLSTENHLPIQIKHKWLHGNFSNLFNNIAFTFSGEESFELQAGEYRVYVKA